MKSIKISQTFRQYYKKYISHDDNLKQEMKNAIEQFIVSRSAVRDHALGSELTGFRSFSINVNYRIVYKETSDYYVLLRVGPHEVVYS